MNAWPWYINGSLRHQERAELLTIYAECLKTNDLAPFHDALRKTLYRIERRQMRNW